MIIVFTGNGKGKTTAALGQAMRALGQAKRVMMIQFIKGPWICGEDKFLKKFQIPPSQFQIFKMGKGFVKILGDSLPLSIHQKAAQKGLRLAEEAIKNQKYDLIILDEINVAVKLGLIKAGQVLKILKINPPEKDIILTGRWAPKSFIRKADLVTEMKEIKHPFQKGKPAVLAREF
ncbi:cob(I)yrinic acid a,c-diamide adenosyltransferase [Candidatus Jorgensenbacteria bacterium CG_4_8_14_3_um_filter_38_10]|nr:MAG: cob(I)yrinic acid a,c-diamide adenosyltransferase [Candidatus Jorgensenbacteria bacterium CG_4_8_14_3_um_filter_38_10]PJA95113.1 MAG: cob(I)yrinic acid a,c-diamide adenosyltransferase [Candidatus Jorgensenbacteria bacterium CG_4_9_14_3_um_filter_38_10]